MIFFIPDCEDGDFRIGEYFSLGEWFVGRYDEDEEIEDEWWAESIKPPEEEE